eukprot:GFYU01029719.1.p1 GENE.GFYU01029719.1~~GFYU01029719.1.p1  ORF type:complete len:571 (-),score=177.99 GFYU01029719.1:349-2061(-)
MRTQSYLRALGIALVVMCTFDVVVSKVLHVSKDSGDDKANDGSEEKPFASPQKAVDEAEKGDVILLEEAEYEGPLVIETCDLKIRSKGCGWAKIVGNDTESYAVHFKETASGCHLERLEVSGAKDAALYVEAAEVLIQDARIRGHANYTCDCKVSDDKDHTCVVFEESAFGSKLYRSDVVDCRYGVEVRSCDSEVLSSWVHFIELDGVRVDGGAANSMVSQSLIEDVGRHGIVAGNYEATTFREKESDEGYEFFESYDAAVTNNFVARAGGAGVAVIGAYGPSVLHNTLIDVATCHHAGIVIDKVSHGQNTTSTCDAEIVNNIVTQSCDSSQPAVSIEKDGSSRDLYMAGNWYHHEDHQVGFVDKNLAEIKEQGNKTAGTEPVYWTQCLDEWQTSTWNDYSSGEGDPLLSNTYHLGFGSPCINTALRPSVVTYDYDQNVRYDANDIGADEFNAGPVRHIPVLLELMSGCPPKDNCTDATDNYNEWESDKYDKEDHVLEETMTSTRLVTSKVQPEQIAFVALVAVVAVTTLIAVAVVISHLRKKSALCNAEPLASTTASEGDLQSEQDILL